MPPEFWKTSLVSELLKALCCDASATACLMRKCNSCRDSLISYKDFDSDAPVIYEQWNQVKEKITLRNRKQKIVTHWAKEQVNSTRFSAVDFLESQIDKFMNHEGIMIHQARQFKFLKMNMTETDVLIHCDFSENYSAKLSTEIQSFHFGGSRKQFTLHTVQVYYKKTAYSPLQSQSICTLSAVNDHGAHAVWAHMNPVLDFVFKNAPNVETIHFQSDCPSTQYRNKTMFFLISRVFAEKDNIKTVTWNYSAPGHGKGAPDGVGGCLKRTADRVVAEGCDIINFSNFVDVLKTNTRNIVLQIIYQEDIDRVSKQIPQSLPTFYGTMKVHQVIFQSSSPGLLRMKSLSCFNCLDCDDYLIGEFNNSKLAARSRKKDNSSLPQQRSPPTAPSADSETDDGPFHPLADSGFPPAGSYALFLNAQSSSNNKTTKICYVESSSSSEDHVMGCCLHPVNDSRRFFTVYLSSATKLRKSDVLRILPSPTIKIMGKKVIRVFPHDMM